MKDNIYLLAFGTFGNPNGFRQSPFIGESKNIFHSIKTFDLNTNAIKLFPNNKLYSIRKEVVNGLNTVAYSVYSFAKEQNSDRGGTFIGSSILFIDEIAEENIIIAKLNEFQDKLIEKNTRNDVLLVNHSDQFSGELPKDFDKLRFGLKKFDELSNFAQTNKVLLVFCETNSHKLRTYLKEALILLNKYDCIYFTADQEIAKFANDKGIYKLIQQVGDKKELDQEVKNLEEEKKQSILRTISEYEKKKNELEEERKKVYDDLKKQIDLNEQKQAENKKNIDRSKADLKDLNNIYENYSQKLDLIINELKADKGLEDINTSHKEYRSVFDEEKRKIHNPSHISSLPNPKITNNISQSKLPDTDHYNAYQERKKRGSKLDVFKLIFFILNILLIIALGALSYYTFFYKKEQVQISGVPVRYEAVNGQIDTRDSLQNKLNPIPDDTANADDKRKVIDALQDKTKIEAVVDAVFDKNPKNVGDVYRYQKNDYKKLLWERNPKAFMVFGNDTVLSKKDSLKIIPTRRTEKKNN